MSTKSLIDTTQRDRALDTSCSFIVQAPAGSGKTTLLVQRYLSLLAKVENPEEILAITFTRKAASEMRERIISALQDPGNTIGLQATKHAQTLDWNLLKHVERLKIQTIDSFCMSLVQSLPVTSGYNSSRDLTGVKDSHYNLAVDQLFHKLYQQHPLANDLAKVLALMGNSYGKVKSVFNTMLKRRDQWLSPISQFVGVNQTSPASAQESINQTLQNLHDGSIEYLLEDFDPDTRAEFEAVGTYAADVLGVEFSWESFANNFTTAQGALRKTLNKNSGFPTDNREWKDRGLAVLNTLVETDKETALELIRNLPQVPISDDLYKEVVTMATGLALAAAQLSQVFAQDSVSDFSELGICALLALHNESGPTDLALALNYRVHHILIDEFQDTSHSQFRLVEELVSGWAPDDGNTLFVVGDPMQSIYRFREAKVSLFLQARDQGVNDVQLESLVLHTNFRSQASLINWFNHCFQRALGDSDVPSLGKIAYSPSTAYSDESTNTPNLKCYASFYQEVQALVTEVQKVSQAHPGDSLAILVRNRTVLPPILSALRNANLPWCAVEIGKLEDENIVRDLITVMRCVAFETDPLCWLALFRCPFVGLTLVDLQCLGSTENFFELMLSQTVPETLSDDGQKRLTALRVAWRNNLSRRFETTPRRFVEHLFEDLGGYDAYPNDLDYEHAEGFFRLVEEQGIRGWDYQSVASALTDLYASGEDKGVEILTIHKSKGLEFDHVFLPGLDRGTRGNRDTIHWRLEQSGLALATTGNDKLIRYLKTEDNIQNANERNRLFYVAATRAKKSLNLSCVLEEEKRPKKGSLIFEAWPALTCEYIDHVEVENQYSRREKPPYLVLPAQFEPIVKTRFTQFSAKSSVTSQWDENSEEPVEASIGTLIHKVLHSLSLNLLPEDANHYVNSQLPMWRSWLKNTVQDSQVEPSLERVQAQLIKTLDDPVGRKILSARNQAHSEFALTHRDKQQAAGKIQNLIIDRTFVASDATRWLVDYKTSSPKPEQSREAFLQHERSTYERQLDTYVNVLQLWDSEHPVKAYLYFTDLAYLLPLN